MPGTMTASSSARPAPQTIVEDRTPPVPTAAPQQSRTVRRRAPREDSSMALVRNITLLLALPVVMSVAIAWNDQGQAASYARIV
jgi:hypothetical protein